MTLQMEKCLASHITQRFTFDAIKTGLSRFKFFNIIKCRAIIDVCPAVPEFTVRVEINVLFPVWHIEVLFQSATADRAGLAGRARAEPGREESKPDAFCGVRAP